MNKIPMPNQGVTMKISSKMQGFSLVELMVVVAIIGILSALAAPTFMGYVHKSQVAEATTFLGEVKERQEAYRAEFSQYSAVCGTAFLGNPAPRAVPDQTKIAWPAGLVNWNQLGAKPDGPVRFVYSTIAGAPGTAAPGNYGFDGTDFWFGVDAIGDLNGDGTQMLVESVSGTNEVFVGKPDGTILAKGWE